MQLPVDMICGVVRHRHGTRSALIRAQLQITHRVCHLKNTMFRPSGGRRKYRTTVITELYRVCCPGVRGKGREGTATAEQSALAKTLNVVGLACENASVSQVARQFGLAAGTVRAITCTLPQSPDTGLLFRFPPVTPRDNHRKLGSMPGNTCHRTNNTGRRGNNRFGDAERSCVAIQLAEVLKRSSAI